MTKQQTNIKERWVTFKRIISIIASFFILYKVVKESLVVHVRKLLFKKYMKNHNICIYIYIYIFNKVEEKRTT